jgi:hypothetical protein
MVVTRSGFPSLEDWPKAPAGHSGVTADAFGQRVVCETCGMIAVWQPQSRAWISADASHDYTGAPERRTAPPPSAVGWDPSPGSPEVSSPQESADDRYWRESGPPGPDEPEGRWELYRAYLARQGNDAEHAEHASFKHRGPQKPQEPAPTLDDLPIPGEATPDDLAAAEAARRGQARQFAHLAKSEEPDPLIEQRKTEARAKQRARRTALGVAQYPHRGANKPSRSREARRIEKQRERARKRGLDPGPTDREVRIMEETLLRLQTMD